MVAGLILAAGRSTRMGQSKALLICPDGRTFVRTLADALRSGGVETPFIVGHRDDDGLRLEVEAIGPGARLVINADADRGGQLSSLVAGLREADRPGIRALIVVPVDAPLVTADTVATLIAAFLAVPFLNLLTPLFAATMMVHLHKSISRTTVAVTALS